MKRCCSHPGPLGTLLCTVMLAAGPGSPALDQAAGLAESARFDRAVPVTDQAPPASDMRARVAWTLLASGSDSAAQRQFSRLAGRQPNAAMPKIGYSLSAAGMGDLSNAARAMRRVLRVNPDALREVELEHRLRLRLETLRTGYLRRLARFDHDRDGAIMLASLCYMLREDETARHAIRYLKSARANGPETRNMERLVLELTQPIVDEIVAQDEPEVPDELDEPLDFTLVFERVEPMSDETAALPKAVEPVTEPQQMMSRELDLLDEPLDFTLVFERLQPPLEETSATPPVTAPAVTETADAAVAAAARPQADPWAPAGVQAIKAEALPVVIDDTPAPPVAEFPVTKMPERVHIDYDKLREDLGAVGGALDSFTQKLIRIISGARQETGSSAP